MNYKLIIFDVDGTLADRDTSILLPNVAQWFAENWRNYRFALASNQGGVGLRYWREQVRAQGGDIGDPEALPTKDSVMQHIGYVLSAVFDAVRTVWKPGPVEQLMPLEITDYICFAYQSKKSGQWGPIPDHKQNDPRWRQDWRKPAPGMLNAAMSDMRVYPQETLMVGDSEEDRLAAEAAHCDFQWADDFFGRRK